MYRSKGVNFKDRKLRTMAGNRPLNHISTRLPKKVKRKKIPLFSEMADSFCFFLWHQINVISNGSTPCKIASDPNIGWEDQLGISGNRAELCTYYQAASHSGWNKPRRQKARNSEHTSAHHFYRGQIIPGPFTNYTVWLTRWEEWISRALTGRSSFRMLIFGKDYKDYKDCQRKWSESHGMKSDIS